jgi:hypothetical protein
MSQVINVKIVELRKNGYQSLQEWLNASPNHIYIGRNMTHYVQGAVGSKWANPFNVKDHGRDGAIKKYEDHVLKNPLLYNSLHELEGKVLGCWCHPDACHGHVLQRLLRESKK